MWRIFGLAALCVALPGPAVRADDAKKADESIKEVAGTAEFLRGVPKHFATLKGVDAPRRRVTLLLEGDKVAKAWPVIPDAEIKLAGWWGRLEQFTTLGRVWDSNASDKLIDTTPFAIGDRVWVWFKTDRAKQPVAVAMLADELSEQDMHGPGVTLAIRSGDELTLTPTKGPNRLVKTEKAAVWRGGKLSALDDFKVGEQVYVQTAGDRVRLLLDREAFEARRQKQRQLLRSRWAEDGLPGTVAFAHTFSGELDFMLDHEAMRWGRSLKTGDKVTLTTKPPIQAVVKHVKPWRERTEVRLVVNSFEQAELTAGQRLHLKMPPPSMEVDSSQLPPDIDRPRDKADRTEWFLANMYCTCKIGGDGCTGMFYTLASCNPNGCGMPNHVRKIIAGKIDKGLTDRQIFEELLKEQGPEMIRPHLLP
jgi:hypothetical protein